MASCNLLQYDPRECQNSYMVVSSCIEKQNGTFDSFLQYLFYPNSRPSGSTFLSDETTLKIFNSCMCDSTADKIQFLLCFSSKCAVNFDNPILSAAGGMWQGYCIGYLTYFSTPHASR
jgi:hypothetical protein